MEDNEKEQQSLLLLFPANYDMKLGLCLSLTEGAAKKEADKQVSFDQIMSPAETREIIQERLCLFYS
jgi:hypothetical protein